MIKIFIYGLGILLIVGLGLWFELNSGDYYLIEKHRISQPSQQRK